MSATSASGSIAPVFVAPATTLTNSGARPAGARQCGHVGSRAAAHEDAAGVGWKPDPFREPAHDLELDLARPGGLHPRADIRIQSGRDEIPQRAWPRPRGGDEREIARV